MTVINSTTRTGSYTSRLTQSAFNAGVLVGKVFRDTIEEDMSTLVETRAANVAPPAQGQVLRVQITDSTTNITLPTSWNTRYVALRAEGQDLQWATHTAALTLTYDATASTTGTTTVGATLKDGERDAFRMYGQTYLGFIGQTATTGYIELWVADNTDY